MSSGEVEEKVFEILSLSGEVLCTVESLSIKKRTSFTLHVIYTQFFIDIATSGRLQLAGWDQLCQVGKIGHERS